jgi:hypothetical protein
MTTDSTGGDALVGMKRLRVALLCDGSRKVFLLVKRIDGVDHTNLTKAYVPTPALLLDPCLD